MNTIEFLKWVLPPEGIYVLFRNSLAEGRHRQSYFQSIEDLVEAAEYYDSTGWDAYFAVSSYKQEGTRKAEDADKVKSFFLDLDCGPEKEFPTKGVAAQELQKFCEVMSLPKPLIVDSGRGLHVYWVLSEAVSVTEWKIVADRFKSLCAEHDFDIDTSVPADTARVLRIVGTHNHKPEVPIPVQVINKRPDAINFDWFADKLGIDTIPVPKKRPHEEGPASLRDALLRNIKYSFRDILVKTQTGDGCEQLARIVSKTEQAETSEPMWRAGLSIAKFCEDGEKAAQKISKEHPDYTPELTLKKLDLIKGPYRCTTFDENEGGICTECPHWGKIKSPLILGRKIDEAKLNEDGTYTTELQELQNAFEGIEDNLYDIEETPEHVIPMYPRPYFRGASGGVYVRNVSIDGEVDEKVIYHNDLYITKRLVDVEAGESVVFKLHLPKDGIREFTLPLTAVISKQEFQKHMAMNGVAITRIDDLLQYMITWINELQANSTADLARRQFGWIDEKATAFVVGDKEIYADKTKYNPPSTPTAPFIPYFEPKGSLEEWKEMANFYTTRPDLVMHQYVVGTAFGSPLMHFLPQNACALHIHANISGCGKSACIKVAASVWGAVKNTMLDERDTESMKFNRAEVLHNIPFYIDELTNEKEDKLSDLAYQLSSGQQRGRMAGGANLERTRGEPWKFLSVTSGNSSVIEKISAKKQQPKAEAQRMMEWPAKKVFDSVEDKRLTDEFEAKLEANYGQAGIPYIQWVIQNVEEVKRTLKEMQIRVDTTAGLKAENRFWSAGVACTLTGIFFANKLGLIDYDLEEVFKWSMTLLKANLNAVENMNVSVEQTLNEYLYDNYNNILLIKSTDDLRKQPDSNGLDKLVIPDASPRIRLVARYETDLRKVYLLPKPLKTWCAAQQINYGALVSDLKTKMGAKRDKVRLGKGTLLKLDPQDVIVVTIKEFDASRGEQDDFDADE